MASTIKKEQKVEFFSVYDDFDQTDTVEKINEILQDGWIIKNQISVIDTSVLVIFEKEI